MQKWIWNKIRQQLNSSADLTDTDREIIQYRKKKIKQHKKITDGSNVLQVCEKLNKETMVRTWKRFCFIMSLSRVANLRNHRKIPPQRELFRHHVSALSSPFVTYIYIEWRTAKRAMIEYSNIKNRPDIFMLAKMQMLWFISSSGPPAPSPP